MSVFDNIKLGPCVLDYGSVHIDLTEGGVTLQVGAQYKDIKVDQHGQSIVDKRITGWDIRAIVPMSKTDYETIKGVAVFLEEDGSSLQDRKLGSSMRAQGQPLTLHPSELPLVDTSQDVVFYLAIPTTPMELKYGYEDTRVYNVEFLALPKLDAETQDAGNFLSIGGAAVDLWPVTFTAEDAAFDPVEGVEISIAGLHTKKLTDAAGQAVFHLPDGVYVYAAQKAPYNLSTDDFEVDGVALPVAVAMTI